MKGYMNEAAKSVLKKAARYGWRIAYSVQVSASGMSRRYTVIVFPGNKGGIVICRDYRIGGCGMDMLFHLFYTILGDCHMAGKLRNQCWGL